MGRNGCGLVNVASPGFWRLTICICAGLSSLGLSVDTTYDPTTTLPRCPDLVCAHILSCRACLYLVHSQESWGPELCWPDRLPDLVSDVRIYVNPLAARRTQEVLHSDRSTALSSIRGPFCTRRSGSGVCLYLKGRVVRSAVCLRVHPPLYMSYWIRPARLPQTQAPRCPIYPARSTLIV